MLEKIVRSYILSIFLFLTVSKVTQNNQKTTRACFQKKTGSCAYPAFIYNYEKYSIV